MAPRKRIKETQQHGLKNPTLKHLIDKYKDVIETILSNKTSGTSKSSSITIP
jgi:hypothetical protein